MSDSDLDDTASTLPKHVLEKIDRAFNQAVAESRPETDRPSKRRRITQEEDDDQAMAGGFIVEDNGGGFLLDSENEQQDIEQGGDDHPEYIPLSLIPRALQILDLNPSDADVLDVFSNASNNEDLVSREDWHSVCTIIYPSTGQSYSEQNIERSEDVADEELSDLSSIPSDDAGSGPSSDEYVPETKPTKQTRTKASSSKKSRKSRRASSTSNSELDAGGTRSLTSRQKSDSLVAYSLFFPDVDKDELPNKSLTIKDIANAASLLKERISAEEVMVVATPHFLPSLLILCSFRL